MTDVSRELDDLLNMTQVDQDFTELDDDDDGELVQQSELDVDHAQQPTHQASASGTQEPPSDDVAADPQMNVAAEAEPDDHDDDNDDDDDLDDDEIDLS